MNKRQRKKLAKKHAIKKGAFTPRNTFRSTMSIKTTLFDPNHPKNEKMIYLAERNLNRLAFVITKPNIVNLTNMKMFSENIFMLTMVTTIDII